VLEAKPDLAEAREGLGRALEKLGFAIESVASHQRALALNPERTETHRNLAFAADPNLGDDLRRAHRYTAACAALAGRGEGREAEKLAPKERRRWRRQALTWLQADLALRAGQLQSGQRAEREEARRKLRQWQQDPDLAGLRDPALTAALPVEEREACRRLWSEIALLLAGVGPRW
jgi:tetratricopeptide (TPR) repeat protein